MKANKNKKLLTAEYNESAFIDNSSLSEQNKSFLKTLINPLQETISLYPTFGWDNPAVIQSALSSHEAGLFSMSELLYQAMKRSPRIYAALRTRVQAMRKYQTKLLVSESAPIMLKKMSKMLERNFFKILPSDVQVEILERLVMIGNCIFRVQLVYDEYIYQYIPKIKVWNHSYIFYNHHEQRYYVNSREHGTIPVVGDGWGMFTTGSSRPWLNGALRALALPFFVANQAMNGWNTFNNVEAKAYKYIKVPSLKAETDETQALYGKVLLAKDGDTIISSDDTEISLLSSQGRSGAYNTYKDLLKWADDTISIILLGNNLVQDIQGGSYAATKEATQSIASDIIESDTQSLEDGINKFIMPIWTDVNFTPAIYGESTLQMYCPMLDLDNIQAQNEEHLSKAHKNYADGFAKFVETLREYTELLKQDVTGEIKEIGVNIKESARRAGVPLAEDKLIRDDIL